MGSKIGPTLISKHNSKWASTSSTQFKVDSKLEFNGAQRGVFKNKIPNLKGLKSTPFSCMGLRTKSES